MNTAFRPPPKPPPFRRSLMCGEAAAVNNERVAWSEPPCHRHHRRGSSVKVAGGFIRAVKPLTMSKPKNSAGNPQDSSDCNVHPTDFYCPWCGETISHECGLDHAHAHMDKGPYAVEVMEAFK